jgi:DENN domain-containing protein 5
MTATPTRAALLTLPALSLSSLTSTEEPLPDRLVDYFCVVNAELSCSDCCSAKPNAAQQEDSCDRDQDCLCCDEHDPTQWMLQTRIRDCFPPPRGDFPTHVDTFVFPNGCHLSQSPPSLSPPPTLFTFVLTAANGQYLYGSALTMYDTKVTAADMKKKKKNKKNKNGSKGPPPPEPVVPSDATGKTKHAPAPPCCYYAPTCLVVLSHYAFFDVLSHFLRQLYGIYASGTSPLPLERYVANFVNDVPLPPIGFAVQWDGLRFSRPAPNQLPLVNYSYQPLFRTLSVANILVVWGLLLHETRVVLCSSNVALLTPCAEALLGLLFPFAWQGIYVPVLPYHLCENVLEAPVPFLVGMNSKYLKQVQPENRPVGVVFVDLDEDIVHLGWDASADGGGAVRPRRMPDLPDAMPLKVQLEEAADHLYLVPSSGIKGRITTGDDPTVLDNTTREPYSQMTRVSQKHADANNDRHFILSNAERAFVDHEPATTWNLLSTQQLIRQSSSSVSSITTLQESSRRHSMQRTSRTVQAHTDRLLAFAGQTYATPFQKTSPVVTEELKLKLASQLYALDDRGGKRPQKNTSTDAATRNGGEPPLHKKVSPNAIRFAFLRFFASILIRYKNFHIARVDGGEPTFQRQAFLNDLHLSAKCRKYISGWLGTQMFERFLLDRRRSRVPDAVILFDEQIIAKRNGDAKFWKGGAKEPTPFLDDTRWKIKQVIVPASPSTWGLAISYGINTVYKYDCFPKLNEKEFVSSGDESWRNHLICKGEMCSWSTSACWPATTEKVLW